MRAGTTRYSLFKQSWIRCALVDHCLSSGLLGGQSLYCWHPSRRSIWILQDTHLLLQGAALTALLKALIQSGVCPLRLCFLWSQGDCRFRTTMICFCAFRQSKGDKQTQNEDRKQAVFQHLVTCGLKWGFNAYFLFFVFSSKGASEVLVSRMQMWVVLARRFRDSSTAHKDWIEILLSRRI